MFFFREFVVLHYIHNDSLWREKHNCVLDMGHQRNCLHRTWYKVINGRHCIIILLPSPNQAADFSSLGFLFIYHFCSTIINYIFLLFFFSLKFCVSLVFFKIGAVTRSCKNMIFHNKQFYELLGFFKNDVVDKSSKNGLKLDLRYRKKNTVHCNKQYFLDFFVYGLWLIKKIYIYVCDS